MSTLVAFLGFLGFSILSIINIYSLYIKNIEYCSKIAFPDYKDISKLYYFCGKPTIMGKEKDIKNHRKHNFHFNILLPQWPF